MPQSIGPVVAGVASVGTGVASVGAGVASVGVGVASVGAGVAAVGLGVSGVSVGAVPVHLLKLPPEYCTVTAPRTLVFSNAYSISLLVRKAFCFTASAPPTYVKLLKAEMSVRR